MMSEMSGVGNGSNPCSSAGSGRIALRRMRNPGPGFISAVFGLEIGAAAAALGSAACGSTAVCGIMLGAPWVIGSPDAETGEQLGLRLEGERQQEGVGPELRGPVGIAERMVEAVERPRPRERAADRRIGGPNVLAVAQKTEGGVGRRGRAFVMPLGHAQPHDAHLR